VARWSEVTAAAPDLAAAVQARFDAHGLGLLATVRADGAPRLSGIEPLFADDVWLGMMDGGRKSADLRRDPRLAMHSATVDKMVTDGDAKLTGRAVLMESADDRAGFRAAVEAATGNPPPDGEFDLFRVDVESISLLTPAGDHIVIEWWREGGEVQRVDRY
jgi:hypothetical protein